MKKAVYFLLCLIIAVGVTACGTVETTTEEIESAEKAEVSAEVSAEPTPTATPEATATPTSTPEPTTTPSATPSPVETKEENYSGTETVGNLTFNYTAIKEPTEETEDGIITKFQFYPDDYLGISVRYADFGELAEDKDVQTVTIKSLLDNFISDMDGELLDRGTVSLTDDIKADYVILSANINGNQYQVAEDMFFDGSEMYIIDTVHKMSGVTEDEFKIGLDDLEQFLKSLKLND